MHGIFKSKLKANSLTTRFFKILFYIFFFDAFDPCFFLLNIEDRNSKSEVPASVTSRGGMNILSITSGKVRDLEEITVFSTFGISKRFPT